MGKSNRLFQFTESPLPSILCKGASFVLFALAGALLFSRFQGTSWNDEMNYLNDAIRFIRTGRLLSGYHPDELWIRYGLEHSGLHSNGFQFLAGTIFRLFGASPESIWIWNITAYLLAAFLLARSYRDRLSLPSFLLLLATPLLFPSCWIYFRSASVEMTILSTALFGTILWNRALSSPSPFAILPFLLVGTIATFFREIEGLWALTGAMLWLIWNSDKSHGNIAEKIKSSAPRALVVAGFLVAAALTFKALNPVRPPRHPNNFRGRIYRNFIASDDWSLTEVIGKIFSHFLENISTFFDSTTEWNFQHTTMRYWFLFLLALGGVQLHKEGMRRHKVLALGFFSTLLAFLSTSALYIVNDYTGFRIIHSSALILFIGLILSLGQKSDARKSSNPLMARPAYTLCAVLAASAAASVHAYSAWTPNDAMNRSLAQVTHSRDLLIQNGAGTLKGDQAIYYDFSGRQSLAMDQALSLLFHLNKHSLESNGPYFHLIYAGIGFNYRPLTQKEMVEAMSRRQLCPAYAVIGSHSSEGLAALREHCGEYDPIFTMEGTHFGAVTARRYVHSWQAPVYARKQK